MPRLEVVDDDDILPLGDELMDGIDFVAISMGIYGFAEIMKNLEISQTRSLVPVKVESVLPTKEDLKVSAGPIARGTLLGSFLGILPGGGALLSSFASYTLEKKLAGERAEPAFGQGNIRGVAGPESANNAGAQTSFIPMLTLGHNFAPANIHAGGLRYHGAGSVVSQLKEDNLMEAVDIPQLETFAAATMFARSEGIIPAPESSHAIAAAIREAKKAKEAGESKVILFNLSGHGLIDMSAYDQYIAGDLANYQLSDEMVRQNTKDLEKII